MSARIYACPSCGGHVDEQARRCRYCAAPIATVRCSTCFHMNIPDAGFCSGCGRQLGLEPVGEAGHLPCPLCKQAMQRYRESQGDLFDCGLCAGQFVEHPLLREMIHRHAVEYAPETAVALPRRPDPRTVYIPCPECTSLMNRKNFGGISGVVVDVCKKHGTWFDEGELPRVLEFVASGGLERAKRREEEEASRVRRDAAVASVRSQGSLPVEAHEPAALGAAFMASLLELLR